MVTREEIERVAARIGAAADAERVVLFGSHAKGTADEDSDVDLLIIADSNLPRFKRSRSLYRLFRPYPFAMDLIVYTPEEVAQEQKTTLSFVSHVLQEGEVIYARGD